MVVYHVERIDGLAPLPLVLVHPGPLQIATFWEWLAIYFHYSVVFLRKNIQVGESMMKSIPKVVFIIAKFSLKESIGFLFSGGFNMI